MEMLEKRKTDIRKQMKRSLKEMDSEEKCKLDHKIFLQTVSQDDFDQMEYVYAYMALSWEADTREILEHLWKLGKKVAFPRVIEDEMEFFEVHSLDELEEGAFHIMEPVKTCSRVDWAGAWILVPGVAFTREGVRLGKGGGYYDKYLEKYPGHKTMALAYEFQIIDDLPKELHDKPVDRVITEDGVFICRNEE